MKKELKPQKRQKLVLSRETLHYLDQPALAPVAGGITEGPSACIEASCGIGCNTRNTCGSRYC